MRRSFFWQQAFHVQFVVWFDIIYTNKLNEATWSSLDIYRFLKQKTTKVWISKDRSILRTCRNQTSQTNDKVDMISSQSVMILSIPNVQYSLKYVIEMSSVWSMYDSWTRPVSCSILYFFLSDLGNGLLWVIKDLVDLQSEPDISSGSLSISI